MATFQPCNKPLEPVRAPAYNPGPDVITSNQNGTYTGSFVRTCALAYNVHHRLILTPDSVWLTIMTQFSTYLENHAEALRSKFVSHEGKKELVVYGGGNLRSANYPALIAGIVEEMKKHIKDPSVADWAVPDFSTTTRDDRVVGSLVLMAAMKKYFGYKMCLCCGLPEVQLLGTVEDWAQLRARAARLLEFDCEPGYMAKWHVMLDKVLGQFCESIAGRPDLEWWNKITNRIGGGSGPTYYSGWITVFSVFDSNGNWMGDRMSQESWGKTVTSEWPIIDSSDLAPCSVTVNVTIDDNGNVVKTVFEAGVAAHRIVDSVGVMPVASWTLSHACD